MLQAESLGAVAELSTRSFADFPEATRAVLSVLERQLQGSAVIAGYFDRSRDRYWVIGSAGDESFGLESGANFPLEESFCIHMASGHAPQLCNRVANDAIYRSITERAGTNINSYVGVPLEISDGARIGSLCAISHDEGVYSESDHELLLVIAKLLAYELEREQAARDLRVLAEQLHEQATTDPLTGLYNRRAFLDALEREWALTNRDGMPSYVVLADLDHFKRLNDTQGHAAGDRALRTFAAAVRATTRETDIAGRLGGDEFAVVLVRTHDPDGPRQFVERLRQAVATQTPTLGVSIGVAALAGSASASECLERADTRMYDDKRTRRDLAVAAG